VTTSAELLGCSLLQAVKKVSTAKVSGEENAKELKALRAENAKLKRAVDKASDQLRIGE
jgi:cell division protein FtsB